MVQLEIVLHGYYDNRCTNFHDLLYTLFRYNILHVVSAIGSQQIFHVFYDQPTSCFYRSRNWFNDRRSVKHSRKYTYHYFLKSLSKSWLNDDNFKADVRDRCNQFFFLQNGTFVGPALSVPLMMFAGFGVSLRDLPNYLKWGSYVSYLRYGLEGYIYIHIYLQCVCACVRIYTHDTHAYMCIFHPFHDVMRKTMLSLILDTLVPYTEWIVQLYLAGTIRKLYTVIIDILINFYRISP